MKAIRERFKKGTAVALTAALLAGLVPTNQKVEAFPSALY